MTTYRTMDICDDCSLIPYDKRIGVVHEWDYEDLDEFEVAEAEGRREQVAFMATIGGELEDHECTAKTEPDLDIQCDCGCNPKRFEWHRNQRKNGK
jgi:hypothetical protein